jgi:hypothetical protein
MINDAASVTGRINDAASLAGRINDAALNPWLWVGLCLPAKMKTYWDKAVFKSQRKGVGAASFSLSGAASNCDSFPLAFARENEMERINKCSKDKTIAKGLTVGATSRRLRFLSFLAIALYFVSLLAKTYRNKLMLKIQNIRSHPHHFSFPVALAK